jgi:hypothetical protein
MHFIGCALILMFSSCNPIEKVRSLFSSQGGPQSQKSPAPGVLESEAARQAVMNRELLSELYHVVFMRAPEDMKEFTAFHENLNQGGSLEGVYNGFTHSRTWRALEEQSTKASPELLKVFAVELAVLMLEYPTLPEFTEADALPLAKPVEPEGDEGEMPKTIEYGKPASTGSPRPSLSALQAQLESTFQKASVFTLKRVLGDEALRVIAMKESSPVALHQWYSRWVVRVLVHKVDFGVSVRHKPEEKWHLEWAARNSTDRLRWEVLTRVQRILNANSGVR